MAEMKSKLQDFYKRLDSRKSTYFLAYSVIFAILAIGVFSFYFFTRKTFIWEVDGWEQHYKSLIYYSQYLRDFFKNIFINHSFLIHVCVRYIAERDDIWSVLLCWSVFGIIFIYSFDIADILLQIK